MEENNYSMPNLNADMEQKELELKRDEAVKWYRAFEDKCHQLILLIKEVPEMPNVDSLGLYDIINKKILEISEAYIKIANTFDPFYNMNIKTFIDVCDTIRKDYEPRFDELIELYSTYKLEGKSDNKNHEEHIEINSETRHLDYKSQIILLIEGFKRDGVVSKNLSESVSKPKSYDFRVRVCLHELNACISKISPEIFTEDDLKKIEILLNRMMKFSFYSDNAKEELFEDVERIKNELLDRENHKSK